MLRFPTLNRINQSRVMTDAFGGLNTNARINSNELSSCLNLSADAYPTLQTRKKRGILETQTEYSAILHTELANYYQPEATIKIPLSGESITISAEGIGTQGVGTRVDDNNITLNIGLGESAYPFAHKLTEAGDIYEKMKPLNNPETVLAQVRVEYVGSSAPANPSIDQFWVDTSNSSNPIMKRYTANGFVRANPANTQRVMEMFPFPQNWSSSKKTEYLTSAAVNYGNYKLKWVEVTEASALPNRFERPYRKSGDSGTLKAFAPKDNNKYIVFSTSIEALAKVRGNINYIRNNYVSLGNVTLTTKGKTTVYELWQTDGRTVYTTSADLFAQYKGNGWSGRVADFKINTGKDIVGEVCDVDGNGVVDERDKTVLNSEIVAIHTWYAGNQPDISELNSIIDYLKQGFAPVRYNKAYDLNDDGEMDNEDLTIAEGYLASRQKFKIPERQTVLSGGILYIFPDNKYVNLADLTDYGSLDAEFTSSSFTLSPSLVTGETITVTTSTTPPLNPSNGDYWLDVSGAEKVLKIYSSTIRAWTGVAAVYTKISATGIGENFNKYDGIKIYKTVNTTQSLVTSAIIYEKTNDYIIVAGILDFTADSIKISRKVPLMDFVTASENRLWGCRSGMTLENENVNEIYASKLGDAKNWSCFMGTSTDSYVASVGSEGAFTGGTVYAGHPIFFKENVIHKVYGNYPSNFQVTTTKARGVQKGSQKSLVVINEILFYKSIDDVCAYDGSLPSSVSEQLNGKKYFEAIAGEVDSKLYIQMKDESGQSHFFSFDTNKGIWHEESIAPIRAFDSYKDKLYYLDSNGVFGVIGNTEGAQEEEDFGWSAEFAPIGYEIADKKYVKRILLKINSQNNVKVYVKYDSDSYVQAYSEEGITDSYAKTRIVPIIPRRCEIMQIKAEGTGEARIYSLTETVRQGSDR